MEKGRRRDQEFKEVVDIDPEKMEDEFGDIMFSLINYARFKGIDPETELEKVNRKFKNRFEYIEDQATKPLFDMSLDEMNKLWNEAKSK